jgi:hypothetical protein
MTGPTFYISDKVYASALKRDRGREAKQAAENAGSHECFTCGRSFIQGDGRFCSTECRASFNAGLPPFQQQETRSTYTWLDGRPMQYRGDGFLIPCAHCKREFVSKGLRCCSTECERKEIAAAIAEAAIERTTRREVRRQYPPLDGDRNGETSDPQRHAFLQSKVPGGCMLVPQGFSVSSGLRSGRQI